MNSIHWMSTLLVCGVLFVWNTTASANDETDGTSDSAENTDMMVVVNDAIAAFKAGQYTVAIEKFQKAFDALGDPNILFNIGRCYEQLGQKESAAEYYNRFIYHPDVPEAAKARARSQLNQLNADQSSTTYYQEPPPEQTSPGETPSESTSSSAPFRLGTEDSTPSRPKVLEWTLIGTGAALVVAGAALGGVALVKHKNFGDADTVKEKQDLEDAGRVLALTSDITLGVGIAAAATGVILMVVRDRKHKKESSQFSMLTPSVLPNGAQLAWTMSF